MSIDPRVIAKQQHLASPPGARAASSDPRNSALAGPDRTLFRRLTAGGTGGNERLTTATGIILVVLLAVIGITLLRMRSLLSVHLFVGMLLIGPIALKMTSTGYRFVRYYTANARYRRKGAPPPALRMLAPIVVLSTVVVFVSGVLLLLLGPSSRSALLPLHKISFIVWVAFTALHVLGHLPELAAGLGFDARAATRADVLAALGSRSADLSPWADPRAGTLGRSGRALSLSGALAGGAVLATVLIPQFGPWLQAARLFHHH